MDIMQLGALGELVGGVAVLVTLFYLVLQVRQGNTNARAASRQTLIQNWSHYVFELSRDREAIRLGGRGVYDFERLSDEEKSQFVFTMNQWVANLYNGILLYQQGILDLPTLDYIGGFVASAVQCKGGAAWWESFPHPREVADYIDDYQRRHGDAVRPQTEVFPYWVKAWDERPATGEA